MKRTPYHKKSKAYKRKKIPWVWGKTEKHAFDSLIRKLTSPPILAFADLSKPFIVNIDASKKGRRRGSFISKMRKGEIK